MGHWDATAAGTETEGAKQYYGTIALSTVERMGDFHVCEGGVTALAVIAKVTTPVCSEKHAADLHIETMQGIATEFVPKAIEVLRQMQTIFEMTAADPKTSDEVSQRVLKCRRLGRYPTDPTAITA